MTSIDPTKSAPQDASQASQDQQPIQRVLVVIPHYCAAEPNAIYGSLTGERVKRATALRQTILALLHGFSWPNCIMHPVSHKATPANHACKRVIKIVVCTIGDSHALDALDLSRNSEYFTQLAVDAPPRLLGFACRNVLASNLGHFDAYCFLEDDILIHDPSFFDKAAWFADTFGEDALLQPNRYEVRASQMFWKGYIDGDITAETSSRLQTLPGPSELTADVLGRSIRFVRPLNPHSGCYFLNAGQMNAWASAPWFAAIDTSFVDPMASAATLGIMRAFKVYKPAMENASFFEVEHAHARYLQRVGVDVPVDEAAFKCA